MFRTAQFLKMYLGMRGVKVLICLDVRPDPNARFLSLKSNDSSMEEHCTGITSAWMHNTHSCAV